MATCSYANFVYIYIDTILHIIQTKGSWYSMDNNKKNIEELRAELNELIKELNQKEL